MPTYTPSAYPQLGNMTTYLTAEFRKIADTLRAWTFGYIKGVGGSVTQATSKSTGVTLHKLCGVITTNNAALGASTSVGFTVTNTFVAATDVVVVSVASGATAASYLVGVDAVSAGSFKVHLRNTSTGSLAEAVVLNFAVVAAVSV